VKGSQDIRFYFSDFDRSRDHFFEQDFKRHGMGTAPVGDEKLAIALKLVVVIFYMVIIIIAVEGHFKLVKPEAAPLLGVTLGLFDLPDQSRIHASSSFRI
jgi:hypothetical protein